MDTRKAIAVIVMRMVTTTDMVWIIFDHVDAFMELLLLLRCAIVVVVDGNDDVTVLLLLLLSL